MINATKLWGSGAPSHHKHAHVQNRSAGRRYPTSTQGASARDAVDGIAAYFAQSEAVNSVIGEIVSHYLSETMTEASTAVHGPVLTTSGASPFDTPVPRLPPLHCDHASTTRACTHPPAATAARRLEPLCVDTSLEFDVVLLGSVSPAAVQLFLESPFGSFQACANAALRRWMEQELLMPSTHDGDVGMLGDPAPLCSFPSFDSVPAQKRPRPTSLYHAIPEHLRTCIASQSQRESLTHSLQCKIWFLPPTVPSVFMPTIATVPPWVGVAAECVDGGAAWCTSATAQQRTPVARGGTVGSSSSDGFLLYADAIVTSLCYAPSQQNNNSSQLLPLVELSRVRPRSVDASAPYAARHLFVDCCIVADLRHLCPADHAEFGLGSRLRILGHCVPLSCSDNGRPGNRTQHEAISHIPPVLLRSASFVVVVVSLERCRGHHHQGLGSLPLDIFERFGTEATCAREAFHCWRGIQDAWCAAQPGMPRGWYLPCYSVDAPIVWAATMVSAMLPQGTLHTAFVAPNSCFLSHLNAMMALIDAGSGGFGTSVTFADRATLERHALPSVAVLCEKRSGCPPAASIEVVRAGVFNHATGTTLFLADLDKFSPSSLRLTSKMMRESSVVVQKGVGDIGAHRRQTGANDSQSLSTTINFASIATVLGRDASPESGGATITPVDNYLAECDVVIAFNKSSPLDQVKDLHWLLSATNTSAAHSTSDVGGASWNHLLSILRRDCSARFTTPQITPLASSILGSYFSTIKAAFPSQVQASLMTVLIRMTSAHAVLRAAWSAPVLLVEPLLSTVEAHSVDALFAVAIVDSGLSRQLNAPMLAFHFVSDAFAALASNFSNQLPQETATVADDYDEALTQWYEVYLQSFLSRF